MTIFDTKIKNFKTTTYIAAKSTIIKEQGDNISKVYILKKGKVSVQEETLNGETVQLKVLRENECFGELELFSPVDCVYNVIAITDCEIVCIDHSELLKCMQEDFRVTKYLYESLCLKLRSSSKNIVQSRTKSIYERLLLHIAEFNENGVCDLDKKKLALYLNTTLRTLNRSLKKAKEDGLISIKKNSLHISSIAKIKKALRDF